MFCTKCGTNIKDTQAFCTVCGTKNEYAKEQSYAPPGFAPPPKNPAPPQEEFSKTVPLKTEDIPQEQPQSAQPVQDSAFKQPEQPIQRTVPAGQPQQNSIPEQPAQPVQNAAPAQPVGQPANTSWENIKEARQNNSAMNSFSEPPKNPDSKKGGGRLALGIICTAVAMAGIIFVLNLLGVIFVGIGSSAQPQIQSSGFETPEQAVEAYVSAMNDADFDGMIATFAVESYVNSYDMEALIERLQSYQPYTSALAPESFGDFGAGLNAGLRAGEISRTMYYQIMALTQPNSPVLDMSPIVLNDEHGINEIMGFLGDESTIDAMNNMHIVEFIDPEDITDMYLNENNVENMRKSADIYGAQDIESVVAKVSVDGEESYMMFDAYKYDDKWYLGAYSGNIGALLAVSATHAGIISVEDFNYGF